MKYAPRQRKLVLETLEDRHVPGVCFNAPLAPDAPVHHSSLRLNDFQPSIDSLRDISIAGLDTFASVPVKSHSVEARRTETRDVDAVSQLSFSLEELNDVLKSSSRLIVFISSNEATRLPSTVAFTHSTMGNSLDASGIFQGVSDLKGIHSETIQSYRTLNPADGLFSILTSGGMKSSSLKGDDPAPNWGQTEYGNIRIDCTTNLASGGNPEGILGNNAKLIPGWFSNVNWSADWDSKNGWNPGSTKTTTAADSASYTPDTEIPVVSGGITGGDPDLRKFVVNVTAQNNTGNHNWDFKLTFENSVRVYKNLNTKAEAPITSGTVFTPTGGNHITKTMTFYLEGITASATFGDVQLSVDYVGGNIPMFSTTDLVNVTVFGVAQTGIFSGEQQDDNEARFKDSRFETRSSYDENGQISWDLPRYLNEPPEGYGSYWCKYFHDCLEIQGTVSPPRDANPGQYYGWTNDGNYPAPNPLPAPLVVFAYSQQVFGSTWTKLENDPIWSHTGPYGIPGEWVDDEPEDIAQSVRPSLTNHIYMIDGPGVDTRDRSVDYVQRYRNFRSSSFISFYGVKVMCSDWYRWHSVMFLKPKDSEYLTRAPNTQAKTFQDFGSGWFNIPTVPDPTDPLTW